MNYNATISINDISQSLTEPVTVNELKNYMRTEGFQDPSNIIPETPLAVTLAQGSATYQNNLLINATIISLSRSGTVYTQGLAAANLVFSFDRTTGTVTFQNVGNTGGEPLAIVYGYTNSGVFNFTGDDTLMSDLITMAREFIEGLAGVSMIAHTWEAVINYTNVCRKMELPNGPNITITSVKDHDGNVIDATSYRLDGNLWKYFSSRFLCGVYTLQYTAGYTTLPRSLKIDLMRLACYMYENRGDDSSINDFGLQLASKYVRQVLV